jgi:hypothetical protein
MEIHAELNDHNAACPDCTLVVAIIGLDDTPGAKSNVQVRLEDDGQTEKGRPRYRLTVEQSSPEQQAR